MRVNERTPLTTVPQPQSFSELCGTVTLITTLISLVILIPVRSGVRKRLIEDWFLAKNCSEIHYPSSGGLVFFKRSDTCTAGDVTGEKYPCWFTSEDLTEECCDFSEQSNTTATFDAICQNARELTDDFDTKTTLIIAALLCCVSVGICAAFIVEQTLKQRQRHFEDEVREVSGIPLNP